MERWPDSSRREEGVNKMVKIQQLMDIVQEQEGDAYVFGIEASKKDPDPKAFDCSELVEWGCARVGVVPIMPDGAENQLDHCREHDTLIPIHQAIDTFGALLFRVPGDGHNHVAFSLGDGSTFEARGKDFGVGSWEANRPGWTHAALIPGVAYADQ